MNKDPEFPSHEGRSRNERLSANELLATPGIVIAVFGTSSGIDIPLAVRTTGPNENGDSAIERAPEYEGIFRGKLSTQVMPHMIDRRGEDAAVAAFREQGYMVNSFTNGNEEYYVMYMPSKDNANREAIKGIVFGWDTNNAELAKRARHALAYDSEGIATMIELWRKIVNAPNSSQVLLGMHTDLSYISPN